jgi:hypothetical protein
MVFSGIQRLKQVGSSEPLTGLAKVKISLDLYCPSCKATTISLEVPPWPVLADESTVAKLSNAFGKI